MNRDHLIKAIEREKWYPTVKPMNFEMQSAYVLNGFLDSLKEMEKDEIMSILRVYKYSMMNIALSLQEEL